MNTPSEKTNFLDKFIGLIESTQASDRFLLRLGLFVLIGAAIWFALSASQQHSTVVATSGGTINEGIIGTPRFVNPVLATTRADQDVASLVYSGLLKIGADGTLENDIAESITQSEDGLSYNIILKNNIVFHDDVPLTADDVVYTIQLIQDPDLKSPLKGNWSDIVVEKVGDHELNVFLKKAYASFTENFTVGIMPSHAWSSLPIEQLPFSQLNTEPIGSGPFSITSSKLDTSGLISDYTLIAFRKNNTSPKIDKLHLAFYQSEDDLLISLQENDIDSTAYVSPHNTESLDSEEFQFIESALPRSFAIFFNQNRNKSLRDDAVREALTVSINRDEIIQKALFGHGIPITGPTAFFQPELELDDSEDVSSSSAITLTPTEILEEANWEKNDLGLWEKEIDDELTVLSITLKTNNSDLFNSVANLVSGQWRELGVDVVIEQYEQTGLVQSVIRPRDFEALLFGIDMNRSYDLYQFWHSSQQEDPGLNIAQYANVQVDDLLEAVETETDNQIRKSTLTKASDIITKERPALFLFQPTVTYIVSNNISVAEMNNLGRLSDRFSKIEDWHTESDSLWTFFQTDDL